MRAIRLFFIVVLALMLVLVALANRELIAVSVIPDGLSQVTGGTWSVRMPAFVVMFLAMAFGLVAGLVWEWLREADVRAQSRAYAQENARLHRELGTARGIGQGAARGPVTTPHDDVLDILDAAQKGREARGDTGQAIARKSAAAALPAPR